MKIKEIMNKAIVIDDNISTKQAAKIMSDKNIGCLIFLKRNKVMGMITERDILKNISSLDRKIAQIMTKKVVTIDENDSIENAALIMTENKIKRLPVIEKGKLIGVITATDIVANSDILNEDFLLD